VWFRITAFALAACAALALAGHVHAAKKGGVTVRLSGDAPKLLSEYGFFVGDLRDLKPNEGVVPYDLNTPLFSDYAAKYRFVWMPKGKSAKYDSENVFEFPVGAVLIKTFAFLHDMRDPAKGQRIIETRLLIRKKKGWDTLVYVWNDEQTEATLKVAGATRDVSWIDLHGTQRTSNYIVPNVNQCKGCHIVEKTVLPIGPKARNLNKSFPYHDGAANQLDRWVQAGYLKGAPSTDAAPKLAVWNDPSTGTVDDRARAWLEINCAHCHNPQGPANTSGLDLRFAQRDPIKWGVMKTPVAAGRGSGGRIYDIVPGKPDESILTFRLESTEPGIMMPELPRRLVDEDSLPLIKEWIATMEQPK
jgi:uncharacterized repeat protein (TIGR03806 family)